MTTPDPNFAAGAGRLWWEHFIHWGAPRVLPLPPPPPPPWWQQLLEVGLKRLGEAHDLFWHHMEAPVLQLLYAFRPIADLELELLKHPDYPLAAITVLTIPWWIYMLRKYYPTTLTDMVHPSLQVRTPYRHWQLSGFQESGMQPYTVKLELVSPHTGELLAGPYYLFSVPNWVEGSGCSSSFQPSPQLSEAGYRLQELPPTGLGEYPLSVGFTVRINLNAIVYREPPEPQLWTLFGPPELEYGPHYLAPGRIAPPGWIPTAPPLPPPPPLPQLPTLPEDMNIPLDEYLEIAHRYLEVVDEILSRTA